MKLKNVLDTSKGRIFFCSDLHYGHSRIIEMNPDNRPFTNVIEMNEWIEKNIWGQLRPGDHLFDLGDTFWKTSDIDIKEILENIPEGVKLYKIEGNHDPYGLYHGQAPLRKYYEVIADSLDIIVRDSGKDYMLSLDHYPKVSWNHKPYGSLMLHGHCHGNIDSYNKSTPDLRVDVGLDGSLCKELNKPMIEFKEILEYFYKITDGVDFMKYVKTNSYNL